MILNALRGTWFILRIIFLVSVFAAIIWVGKNPTKTGEWYAKWQKGQLTEFYKR